MRIGVPKEIKNNENRVSVTPAGVVSFVKNGHEVWVEKNAGIGSGFSDQEFVAAGAKILNTAAEVWAADLVIKVKEPLAPEYKFFRKDLTLFTYLHLAPEPELTQALIDAGTFAIAYETVEKDGSLPLLTPMSEIAGRMATQVGAQNLEKIHGGRGVLLAGVPGVPRGKVTIIGGGVAGTNAAKMAVGLGAQVTILDVNVKRLVELDDLFGLDIQTLYSTPANIEESIKEADLVIGAVLIVGQKAPTLISEDMVKKMKPGSVIVDIAIDQGGIFETIDHITTHDNPTYVTHDVVHYAVANMPGAVPRTSTFALTNVTLPYALSIANLGAKEACLRDPALRKGINVYNGLVTNDGVALALNKEYHPIDSVLK